MEKDYTTYPGSDMYDKPAEVASQPLNDLLVAIREINDICENTPELGCVHAVEDAMKSDGALTDILKICEKVLKKYPESN